MVLTDINVSDTNVALLTKFLTFLVCGSRGTSIGSEVDKQALFIF